MNWNYPFESTEIFFIFFFIVVYFAFLFRTIRVARRLNTTARTLILKLFLRTIYFGLLIISLLGPSFGEATREIQAKGKDIYLLVDLSKSMDATDISPTRIEKVKFEINRFIRHEAANRIGIIIFSNDAFTHAPLTYDHNALALFVQTLNTGLLPTSGSNPCAALNLAYQKLIQQSSDMTNRSKSIVLFSDGENQNDCEGPLINNIRRFGVATYMVGVGTKTGISILDNGIALKNDQGKIVITKLDESFLKNLAQQTRGNYYKINNEKNEINRLISDLNNAESTLIDTRTVTIVSNKYFYFLGAALLLLIIDILVTIRTFKL
jgi:Ca-activated chloride channel family protein